ncbi:uncharacterized protein JN550_011279 [Neoarthrinium moseri]|uniref:uncharacterized protein n=1 Tax=Neoarthrinium moseri TaxID=1658444 RepID=UPI001FDCB93D|nr:uncharacterized protein JN550_011279 [Neoarthrinium moseri]KAI1860817.1 hypothetical protein JN550_011279 [Neoarthrinium moseri]
MDFPQFSNLPTEVRLLIWSLCVPGPRVYEMGTAARRENHNTLPRTASLWSPQAGVTPVVSHVCHEARQVVLQNRHYLMDQDEHRPLPLRKGIDIVHLNWHPGYNDHDYLPDVPDPLPKFRWLAGQAGAASVSAELLHPFNYEAWGWFHEEHEISDPIFHINFLTGRQYHVVLAIIEIHMSEYAAAAQTQVFGTLGEEPIQLVDPRDTATIVKFRDAWRTGQHLDEPEIAKFFATVLDSAETFAASVQQWLQELEMAWIWHRCNMLGVTEQGRNELWTPDPSAWSGGHIQPPPPQLFQMRNRWAGRKLNRESPLVQTQLQRMPRFVPALMFRHCKYWLGQPGFSNSIKLSVDRGQPYSNHESRYRDIYTPNLRCHLGNCPHWRRPAHQSPAYGHCTRAHYFSSPEVSVSMKMAVRNLVLLAAALVGSGSNPGSVALAASSGDMEAMDAQPNYPSDPNTTPYCSWWWDNDGSIPCEDMPDAWGITMDDFVRWNPSLASGCGAYKQFMSYCVDASGEPPVSTTAKPTTVTSTKISTTMSSSVRTSTTSTMVTSTTRPTTSNTLTTPTTTTSTKPTNGIATPTPIQPGMVENCDAFYLVQSGDNCEVIASKNGISVTQFLTWNTDIGGSACNGLWAEAYVCVSVIGHTPATPTTTKPGNGIATPTPTQPGMVDNCDAFYKVASGDNCDVIAAKNGITTSQFLQWNTEVGGTACNGLWAEVYVCVSVIGHTPTPTTSKPGNGIATPTPTQPGMVANCDAFHKVVSGDSCATIASKNGITVTQLAAWNDVGGTSCPGLWLDVYVCVSIVGHTPATPTTTRPGNGVATPTPTQSGMTPNCKSFHFVATGENCATIASKYKISTTQFINWNPAVGSGCAGLWANTYACVAVL